MLFLHLLAESWVMAIGALWSNKLRSFLSLLGITVGIFSIITVFTIVDSLEASIRSSVQSLGEDVLYVTKFPWTFEENQKWWKLIHRPSPDLDDYACLKSKLSNAGAIVFRVSTNKTVKHENNAIENAEISGISDGFEKINGFDLAHGRFLSYAEIESGKSVVVVGYAIAEGLFKQAESAIGQTIHVKGNRLKIVGIIQKEGENPIGSSLDNTVLMSYRAVQKIMDIKSNTVEPFLALKPLPGIPITLLKDEIRRAMRGNRRLSPTEEDNFSINEISVLSGAFESIFDVIGTAGWIIGGFSILVGGFGIANIMFVSVRERTSQIGIQKSLGAKNYFILIQFLTESIVLCLTGGLIGLGLILIGIALAGDDMGIQLFLSRSNIILGISISVLIGLISGFIPAYGASQLDPVEAIRSNG